MRIDPRCMGCVPASLNSVSTHLWNVMRDDGEMMLRSHTDLETATKALLRYRSMAGKPYPNRRVFYPKWKLRLALIGDYWSGE